MEEKKEGPALAKILLMREEGKTTYLNSTQITLD
jgi:hypothetical protein